MSQIDLHIWSPYRPLSLFLCLWVTPLPLLLLSLSRVTKLKGIGHCGREQNDIDVRGQHNDHFLPHYTPLEVVDVVHLVEDDPLYVANEIGALRRREVRE